MNISTKTLFFEECEKIIQNRITNIQKEIKLSQDSANSDTKSSMGDKYETGQAMAHLEKEKMTGRLSETIFLLKVLNEIDYREQHDTAQLGSLVKTSSGLFLIGASLGQLKINDVNVFCISPVSPLGRALIGKKATDNYSLNGREFKITSII